MHNNFTGGFKVLFLEWSSLAQVATFPLPFNLALLKLRSDSCFICCGLLIHTNALSLTGHLQTSALQLLSLHPFISYPLTQSNNLYSFSVGIPYPNILHVKSSKFCSLSAQLPLPSYQSCCTEGLLRNFTVSAPLYLHVFSFPSFSVLSTLCVKDPSHAEWHQVIFTAQVFATLSCSYLVLFGKPGDL